MKIAYWIVTGLFAAFMAFSGVQNIMVDQGSIDLITTQLGFPQYMIPFLGVGKLVGSIVILVPGFPRIKEWAYAGLFFDLTGAMFAGIMVGGASGLFMLIFIVVHLASYVLYHKVQKPVIVG
ncbi:MAG TPA: DoxX family protein [Cyclobacteriaceae bacterium]|nr:DoxX family protein [Cyclobacteriaceae bacterium]